MCTGSRAAWVCYRGAALFAFAAGLAACASGPGDSCAPGARFVCVGAAACDGISVCTPKGRLGPCECPRSDAAPIRDAPPADRDGPLDAGADTSHQGEAARDVPDDIGSSDARPAGFDAAADGDAEGQPHDPGGRDADTTDRPIADVSTIDMGIASDGAAVPISIRIQSVAVCAFFRPPLIKGVIEVTNPGPTAVDVRGQGGRLTVAGQSWGDSVWTSVVVEPGATRTTDFYTILFGAGTAACNEVCPLRGMSARVSATFGYSSIDRVSHGTLDVTFQPFTITCSP